MPEPYYERLGVPRDATTAEIRTAYREGLKEAHPDVNDDPDAADRTRELLEAKEVLTDERERARYDRLGHEAYLDGRGDIGANVTTETDVSSGSADGATDRTVAGDGNWGAAGTRTGTAGGATAESSSGDRATRHARNRATRAKWNTAGGGSDAGQPHSRGSGTSRRVYREDRSRLGNRLFPPGESLVLLLAAFALYPVMLWAALEPAFPLPVNLAVAVCLLLVVGFLLSMPSVAVAVFGSWSVLLPAVLVFGAGLDLFSLVGGVALAATLVPLGLSLLALFALRT